MEKHLNKVCHLTSAHRALDSRLFSREAVSLARAGYSVTVIGLHQNEEVVNSVRIVPLSYSNNRVNRFTIGLGQLIRLAFRERADLYHFHDPDLIPVGLLLKLAGKRVIYDVHEDYKQSIKSKDWIPALLRNSVASLFSSFEYIASNFFDLIIAVDSNFGRKFPVKKTAIIRNVPPLRFLPSNTNIANADNDNFRIIYIGGVSWARGVGKMLNALPKTKHKENIEFHIMGFVQDSELLGLMEDSPKTIYHGRVGDKDASRMLTHANVGIVLYQPNSASLNFSGENSTKLFEYMAAGLPVLYPDFPKFRKFVSSIGCGIPVDPTDPQKIAEAVDYLYENPEIRHEMARKGMDAIRDQYNWEHEEEELLRIYATILAKDQQIAITPLTEEK